MDRNTAVTTWRDVCGNDTVMASGIVTGRMLEDFAKRIAAAERKRWAEVCDANAKNKREWYGKTECEDYRGAAEMAEWLANCIRGV